MSDSPDSLELDPRWEWVEVQRLGDPAPKYVRGPCKHLEVVPVVDIVDSLIVARLCLTCDEQLPA